MALPLGNTVSEGAVTTIVVSFVFASLATVAVGLRFYVRRWMRKIGLLPEDWVIFAALVFDWTCVAVYCVLGFKAGLGWPSDRLAPETVELSNKLFALAGSLNWPIASTLVKISICLSFIRIFFIFRKFRIVATTVYILTILWCLAAILVGFLICTPISELWTMAKSGHCGDTTAAFASLGLLDVVFDIVVFSLPIPILYRLQMPTHAKVALIATFGLGIFSIVAAIIKLVATIRINSNMRFEEAQVWRAYWCTIECSVGIIVACAMTLRPLLDRALSACQRGFSRVPGIGSTRHRSSRGSSSTQSATLVDGVAFEMPDEEHKTTFKGLDFPLDFEKDHALEASFENF